MNEPDAAFVEQIKRGILDAYGYTDEAELNADIEAEFPGYLEARAEYEAQREAFAAALPQMMKRVRQQVPAQMKAWGTSLPEGYEFAWEAS